MQKRELPYLFLEKLVAVRERHFYSLFVLNVSLTAHRGCEVATHPSESTGSGVQSGVAAVRAPVALQVADETAPFCSTLPSSECRADADEGETVTFTLYLLATWTIFPVDPALPTDVKDEWLKKQMWEWEPMDSF